jgi:putative membrane protein
VVTAHDLPSLNACLNGAAAVLLATGRMAIKRGDRELHRRLMLAALATSALFLVSYLYYHFNVKLMTRYAGDGADRALYLFILATHVLLAPFVVPFSLAAIWHAWRGRLDTHTRITRWLWPVWLYVSVTGVAIYLLLYVFPGQPA